MPLHAVRASGTILSGGAAGNYTADHALSDANLSLVANIGRVSGFFAENTAGSLLQMAADSIVFQTAANGIPVWDSQPTFLACNVATSGPVANGRDRSASFANGAWIYFYFIKNISTGTKATLCSPVRANPVLPAGYTHWCYATAIRAVGTNIMNEVYVRGARVHYMSSDPSSQRVLSAGRATTFTSVNCATWVPPEARGVIIDWNLNVVHATAGVLFVAYWRNGVVQPLGQPAVGAVSSGGAALGVNTREMPIQQDGFVQYRLSSVPSGIGGVSLDIAGYVTTNGDS